MEETEVLEARGGRVHFTEFLDGGRGSEGLETVGRSQDVDWVGFVP